MSTNKPKSKSLMGVYSTPNSKSPAPGRTKNLWTVHKVDDKQVEVQPVNKNMAPTGAPKRLTHEEFERLYNREEDYLVRPSEERTKVKPDEPLPQSPANKPIVPDEVVLDKHPFDYETMSPEGRVLSQKMAVMHSDGREMLMRGEVEPATKVYKKILALPGKVEPDHKYMLSDCAVDMRKVGQHDMALGFYQKALSAVKDDEHMYHNVARIHFERGEVDEAIKNLQKSLEVNPKLMESHKFLRYIRRRYMAQDDES